MRRAAAGSLRSSRSGRTQPYCSCVFRSRSRRPRMSSRRMSSSTGRTPSMTIPHRFPYTRPGSSRVGKGDPHPGLCSRAWWSPGFRPRSSSPAGPRSCGWMSVILFGNGRSMTRPTRASPSSRRTKRALVRPLRFVPSERLLLTSSPTSSCTFDRRHQKTSQGLKFLQVGSSNVVSRKRPGGKRGTRGLD